MSAKKKDANSTEETKTAQNVVSRVDHANEVKNLIHSLHNKGEFIRDLADRNLRNFNQKYAPNYKSVLKFRLLQKRKTLTEDLLLINSVLDKLQSL